MTREEAVEVMRSVASGWRERIDSQQQQAKALRTISAEKVSLRNQCESLADESDRSALRLASKLLALQLVLSAVEVEKVDG